jgi:peptidyl-prolyl cis-trans isomerase C
MFHSFVRQTLGLFLLGLALAAPLWAESHSADATRALSADEVIAKVGEAEITLGHILATAAVLPDEQLDAPPEELFSKILDRLVQEEAIGQAGGAMSLLTELRLDNQRRSLIASSVIDRVMSNINPTDEQVLSAYDAQYGDALKTIEYNASHILLETEEEALAVLADLEAGVDFAVAARAKSIGPSGPNGGNLGWFGPGRMVQGFQTTVEALTVGEISEPIQTEFGWHVIKLMDKRTPNAPSFEDIRDELAGQIAQEIFSETVSAIIDAAPVERFEIEGLDPAALLDPKVLGRDG